METFSRVKRLAAAIASSLGSLLGSRPRPRPPASGKSTIAVVDDDPRVLQSLQNLLESYGYVVRCYSSAIALLKDDVLFEIDCIISDIGMPVMDGFELQRRAGTERPQLPVILITARHDVSRTAAAATNNRGFFQKPFDAPDLLKAVSDALRGSR